MKNAPEKQIGGMTFFWGLARRSILFHLRGSILLCAGSAISTAVLLGTLIAGSSLRGSVRELHTQRLGEVKWVINGAGGYFRASIADSVAAYLAVKAAPVQFLTGAASAAEADDGAVNVNIIGVDERFWELGPRPAAPQNISASFRGNTGDISVIVNSALAEKLGIESGGDITLRFQSARPSAADAPFSPQDGLATLRLPVESVADAGSFGDFSLKAEHSVVYNVFVPMKLLQSVNNTPGMAGAILIDKQVDRLSNKFPDISTDKPSGAPINESYNTAYENIIGAVQKSLSIRDAGLNIRRLESGAVPQNSADTAQADADRNTDFEIYSDRIFISDTLRNAITGAIPESAPLFAWFVNEIKAVSGLSTPYSFVSTPPPEYSLGGNRIALCAWAARDLAVAIGDSVTLTYFVSRPESGGLRLDSSVFAVSAILHDTVSWLNKSLTPPYPGLADAGRCTDWNSSIPIDLTKIRREDEEYWKKYSGTPKAIISYDKAAQIWANRFGVCTAVRVPGNISVDNNMDNIESAIAASLTPSLCGIRLTDTHTDADNTAGNGMDFVPIFWELSFFAFVSPILLIWFLSSMRFRLRAGEYRILTAVGYSRRHILLICVSEGLLIFSIGTLAGIILCPIYALIIIAALKSVWEAAAVTRIVNLHIEILPIVVGSAAAFVCAFLSMLIPIFFAMGRRASTSSRVCRFKDELQ